ncbi:MAG: isoprenylcysteine carboxylmethyltransferase family protein [Gammaproteobacteria bacterium]|nr:isoprenylcysteine carboxylmethyltransferase family protein [Gammaproteobacteria bacterium]
MGILCAATGLALGVWTASLFARFGGGTAAPWDPPRRFVVRGPYRHVRNPMITGALALLLGESLIVQSWPLFGWLVVFALGNALYIPLVEERGLAKRFGEEYAAYQRHVPRWIPRPTPWAPGRERA